MSVIREATTNELTVRQARHRLEREVRKGNFHDQPNCPVCGRNAGYELALSRGHAAELARFMYEINREFNMLLADPRMPNPRTMLDTPLHVPSVLGATADSYSQNCIAQMKHFALVRPTPSRGWWRLTADGRNWILGKRQSFRRVWMFRDEVVRFEPEKVSAYDLLPAAEITRILRTGQLRE